MGQVSIPLLVIHSVPDDKNVRDFKPAIGDWQVNQSSGRFVEQGANVDACGFALPEIVQKVVCGESGINDVLDE